MGKNSKKDKSKAGRKMVPEKGLKGATALASSLAVPSVVSTARQVGAQPSPPPKNPAAQASVAATAPTTTPALPGLAKLKGKKSRAQSSGSTSQIDDNMSSQSPKEPNQALASALFQDGRSLKHEVKNQETVLLSPLTSILTQTPENSSSFNKSEDTLSIEISTSKTSSNSDREKGVKCHIDFSQKSMEVPVETKNKPGRVPKPTQEFKVPQQSKAEKPKDVQVAEIPEALLITESREPPKESMNATQTAASIRLDTKNVEVAHVTKCSTHVSSWLHDKLVLETKIVAMSLEAALSTPPPRETLKIPAGGNNAQRDSSREVDIEHKYPSSVSPRDGILPHDSGSCYGITKEETQVETAKDRNSSSLGPVIMQKKKEESETLDKTSPGSAAASKRVSDTLWTILENFEQQIHQDKTSQKMSAPISKLRQNAESEHKTRSKQTGNMDPVLAHATTTHVTPVVNEAWAIKTEKQLQELLGTGAITEYERQNKPYQVSVSPTFEANTLDTHGELKNEDIQTKLTDIDKATPLYINQTTIPSNSVNAQEKASSIGENGHKTLNDNQKSEVAIAAVEPQQQYKHINLLQSPKDPIIQSRELDDEQQVILQEPTFANVLHSQHVLLHKEQKLKVPRESLGEEPQKKTDERPVKKIIKQANLAEELMSEKKPIVAHQTKDEGLTSERRGMGNDIHEHKHCQLEKELKKVILTETTADMTKNESLVSRQQVNPNDTVGTTCKSPCKLDKTQEDAIPTEATLYATPKNITQKQIQVPELKDESQPVLPANIFPPRDDRFQKLDTTKSLEVDLQQPEKVTMLLSPDKDKHEARCALTEASTIAEEKHNLPLDGESLYRKALVETDEATDLQEVYPAVEFQQVQEQASAQVLKQEELLYMSLLSEQDSLIDSQNPEIKYMSIEEGLQGGIQKGPEKPSNIKKKPPQDHNHEYNSTAPATPDFKVHEEQISDNSSCEENTTLSPDQIIKKQEWDSQAPPHSAIQDSKSIMVDKHVAKDILEPHGVVAIPQHQHNETPQQGIMDALIQQGVNQEPQAADLEPTPWVSGLHCQQGQEHIHEEQTSHTANGQSLELNNNDKETVTDGGRNVQLPTTQTDMINGGQEIMLPDPATNVDGDHQCAHKELQNKFASLDEAEREYNIQDADGRKPLIKQTSQEIQFEELAQLLMKQASVPQDDEKNTKQAQEDNSLEEDSTQDPEHRNLQDAACEQEQSFMLIDEDPVDTNFHMTYQDIKSRTEDIKLDQESHLVTLPDSNVEDVADNLADTSVDFGVIEHMDRFTEVEATLKQEESVNEIHPPEINMFSDFDKLCTEPIQVADTQVAITTSAVSTSIDVAVQENQDHHKGSTETPDQVKTDMDRQKFEKATVSMRIQQVDEMQGPEIAHVSQDTEQEALDAEHYRLCGHNTTPSSKNKQLNSYVGQPVVEPDRSGQIEIAPVDTGENKEVQPCIELLADESLSSQLTKPEVIATHDENKISTEEVITEHKHASLYIAEDALQKPETARVALAKKQKGHGHGFGQDHPDSIIQEPAITSVPGQVGNDWELEVENITQDQNETRQAMEATFLSTLEGVHNEVRDLEETEIQQAPEVQIEQGVKLINSMDKQKQKIEDLREIATQTTNQVQLVYQHTKQPVNDKDIMHSIDQCKTESTTVHTDTSRIIEGKQACLDVNQGKSKEQKPQMADAEIEEELKCESIGLTEPGFTEVQIGVVNEYMPQEWELQMTEAAIEKEPTSDNIQIMQASQDLDIREEASSNTHEQWEAIPEPGVADNNIGEVSECKSEEKELQTTNVAAVGKDIDIREAVSCRTDEQREAIYEPQLAAVQIKDVNEDKPKEKVLHVTNTAVQKEPANETTEITIAPEDIFHKKEATSNRVAKTPAPEDTNMKEEVIFKADEQREVACEPNVAGVQIADVSMNQLQVGMEGSQQPEEPRAAQKPDDELDCGQNESVLNNEPLAQTNKQEVEIDELHETDEQDEPHAKIVEEDQKTNTREPNRQESGSPAEADACENEDHSHLDIHQSQNVNDEPTLTEQKQECSQFVVFDNQEHALGIDEQTRDRQQLEDEGQNFDIISKSNENMQKSEVHEDKTDWEKTTYDLEQIENGRPPTHPSQDEESKIGELKNNAAVIIMVTESSPFLTEISSKLENVTLEMEKDLEIEEQPSPDAEEYTNELKKLEVISETDEQKKNTVVKEQASVDAVDQKNNAQEVKDTEISFPPVTEGQGLNVRCLSIQEQSATQGTDESVSAELRTKEPDFAQILTPPAEQIQKLSTLDAYAEESKEEVEHFEVRNMGQEQATSVVSNKLENIEQFNKQVATDNSDDAANESSDVWNLNMADVSSHSNHDGATNLPKQGKCGESKLREQCNKEPWWDHNTLPSTDEKQVSGNEFEEVQQTVDQVQEPNVEVQPTDAQVKNSQTNDGDKQKNGDHDMEAGSVCKSPLLIEEFDHEKHAQALVCTEETQTFQSVGECYDQVQEPKRINEAAMQSKTLDEHEETETEQRNSVQHPQCEENTCAVNKEFHSIEKKNEEMQVGAQENASQDERQCEVMAIELEEKLANKVCGILSHDDVSINMSEKPAEKKNHIKAQNVATDIEECQDEASKINQTHEKVDTMRDFPGKDPNQANNAPVIDEQATKNIEQASYMQNVSLQQQGKLQRIDQTTLVKQEDDQQNEVQEPMQKQTINAVESIAPRENSLKLDDEETESGEPMGNEMDKQQDATEELESNKNQTGTSHESIVPADDVSHDLDAAPTKADDSAQTKATIAAEDMHTYDQPLQETSCEILIVTDNGAPLEAASCAQKAHTPQKVGISNLIIEQKQSSGTDRFSMETSLEEQKLEAANQSVNADMEKGDKQGHQIATGLLRTQEEAQGREEVDVNEHEAKVQQLDISTGQIESITDFSQIQDKPTRNTLENEAERGSILIEAIIPSKISNKDGDAPKEPDDKKEATEQIQERDKVQSEEVSTIDEQVTTPDKERDGTQVCELRGASFDEVFRNDKQVRTLDEESNGTQESKIIGASLEADKEEFKDASQKPNAKEEVGEQNQGNEALRTEVEEQILTLKEERDNIQESKIQGAPPEADKDGFKDATQELNDKKETAEQNQRRGDEPSDEAFTEPKVEEQVPTLDEERDGRQECEITKAPVEAAEDGSKDATQEPHDKQEAIEQNQERDKEPSDEVSREPNVEVQVLSLTNKTNGKEECEIIRAPLEADKDRFEDAAQEPHNKEEAAEQNLERDKVPSGNVSTESKVDDQVTTLNKERDDMHESKLRGAPFDEVITVDRQVTTLNEERDDTQESKITGASIETGKQGFEDATQKPNDKEETAEQNCRGNEVSSAEVEDQVFTLEEKKENTQENEIKGAPFEADKAGFKDATQEPNDREEEAEQIQERDETPSDEAFTEPKIKERVPTLKEERDGRQEFEITGAPFEAHEDRFKDTAQEPQDTEGAIEQSQERNGVPSDEVSTEPKVAMQTQNLNEETYCTEECEITETPVESDRNGFALNDREEAPEKIRDETPSDEAFTESKIKEQVPTLNEERDGRQECEITGAPLEAHGDGFKDTTQEPHDKEGAIEQRQERNGVPSDEVATEPKVAVKTQNLNEETYSTDECEITEAPVESERDGFKRNDREEAAEQIKERDKTQSDEAFTGPKIKEQVPTLNEEKDGRLECEITGAPLEAHEDGFKDIAQEPHDKEGTIEQRQERNGVPFNEVSTEPKVAVQTQNLNEETYSTEECEITEAPVESDRDGFKDDAQEPYDKEEAAKQNQERDELPSNQVSTKPKVEEQVQNLNKERDGTQECEIAGASHEVDKNGFRNAVPHDNEEAMEENQERGEVLPDKICVEPKVDEQVTPLEEEKDGTQESEIKKAPFKGDRDGFKDATHEPNDKEEATEQNQGRDEVPLGEIFTKPKVEGQVMTVNKQKDGTEETEITGCKEVNVNKQGEKVKHTKVSPDEAECTTKDEATLDTLINEAERDRVLIKDIIPPEEEHLSFNVDRLKDAAQEPADNKEGTEQNQERDQVPSDEVFTAPKSEDQVTILYKNRDNTEETEKTRVPFEADKDSQEQNLSVAEAEKTNETEKIRETCTNPSELSGNKGEGEKIISTGYTDMLRQLVMDNNFENKEEALQAVDNTIEADEKNNQEETREDPAAPKTVKQTLVQATRGIKGINVPIAAEGCAKIESQPKAHPSESESDQPMSTDEDCLSKDAEKSSSANSIKVQTVAAGEPECATSTTKQLECDIGEPQAKGDPLEQESDCQCEQVHTSLVHSGDTLNVAEKHQIDIGELEMANTSLNVEMQMEDMDQMEIANIALVKTSDTIKVEATESDEEVEHDRQEEKIISIVVELKRDGIINKDDTEECKEVEKILKLESTDSLDINEDWDDTEKRACIEEFERPHKTIQVEPTNSIEVDKINRNGSEELKGSQETLKLEAIISIEVDKEKDNTEEPAKTEDLEGTEKTLQLEATHSIEVKIEWDDTERKDGTEQLQAVEEALRINLTVVSIERDNTEKLERPEKTLQLGTTNSLEAGIEKDDSKKSDGIEKLKEAGKTFKLETIESTELNIERESTEQSVDVDEVEEQKQTLQLAAADLIDVDINRDYTEGKDHTEEFKEAEETLILDTYDSIKEDIERDEVQDLKGADQETEQRSPTLRDGQDHLIHADEQNIKLHQIDGVSVPLDGMTTTLQHEVTDVSLEDIRQSEKYEKSNTTAQSDEVRKLSLTNIVPTELQKQESSLVDEGQGHEDISSTELDTKTTFSVDGPEAPLDIQQYNNETEERQNPVDSLVQQQESTVKDEEKDGEQNLLTTNEHFDSRASSKDEVAVHEEQPYTDAQEEEPEVKELGIKAELKMSCTKQVEDRVTCKDIDQALDVNQNIQLNEQTSQNCDKDFEYRRDVYENASANGLLSDIAPTKHDKAQNMQVMQEVLGEPNQKVLEDMDDDESQTITGNHIPTGEQKDNVQMLNEPVKDEPHQSHPTESQKSSTLSLDGIYTRVASNLLLVELQKSTAAIEAESEIQILKETFAPTEETPKLEEPAMRNLEGLIVDNGGSRAVHQKEQMQDLEVSDVGPNEQNVMPAATEVDGIAMEPPSSTYKEKKKTGVEELTVHITQPDNSSDNSRLDESTYDSPDQTPREADVKIPEERQQNAREDPAPLDIIEDEAELQLHNTTMELQKESFKIESTQLSADSAMFTDRQEDEVDATKQGLEGKPGDSPQDKERSNNDSHQQQKEVDEASQSLQQAAQLVTCLTTELSAPSCSTKDKEQTSGSNQNEDQEAVSMVFAVQLDKQSQKLESECVPTTSLYQKHPSTEGSHEVQEPKAIAATIEGTFEQEDQNKLGNELLSDNWHELGATKTAEIAKKDCSKDIDSV